MVPVGELKVVPELQIRDNLDPRAVGDYMEMYLERGPESVPPLRAFEVPGMGLLLTSGAHRRQAALSAKDASALVPVEVFKGGLRDAQIDSKQHNRDHGVRLSHAERARTVEWFLADPEFGPKTPDTELARLTGETRKFVATIRASWEARQEVKPPPVRETTRGGKKITQKVGNIGKSPKRPAGKAAALQSVDDVVGDGSGETDREKVARQERSYLESIPLRKQLHEDRREDFDRNALAYKRAEQHLAELGKVAASSHPNDLKDPGPFVHQLEVMSHISGPLGRASGAQRSGRHTPGWVACTACKTADKKSCGRLTGKKADPRGKTVCKDCRGHGYRVQGGLPPVFAD